MLFFFFLSLKKTFSFEFADRASTRF